MRRTVFALVLVLAVAGCRSAAASAPQVRRTTAAVRVQPVAVHRRGGPIAWVDTAAPPYTPPKALPAKPLPRSAPACPSSALTVADLGYSGRTSDRGVVLRFTNASPRPCLLLGYPRVTTWGVGYGPVVVRARQAVGTSFDMPPGESTYLWLSATADCLSGPAYGRAPTISRVAIAMPGGGVERVGGLAMPRTCDGVGESSFYRSTPEPEYPPVPLSGARLFLETPSAPAHAGHPYVYVLVVRNATTKPMTLRPCPAYQQWLSIGTNTTPDLLLNCGTRRSLPPGQVLRFAMHVMIPADTPTGTAVLAWGLRDGVFKDAGRRTIHVVGNDIPCHAGQLTAAAAQAAVPFAGAGIYEVKDSGTSLTVTVTNTSTALCTLQGAPTVAVTAGNGRGLGLRWGDEGFGQHLPSPTQVTLAPGGSARTVLSWQAKWCGPDPNPVAVTLGLPGDGGSLRFQPLQGWTPPTCKGWNFPDQVSSTPFG